MIWAGNLKTPPIWKLPFSLSWSVAPPRKWRPRLTPFGTQHRSLHCSHLNWGKEMNFLQCKQEVWKKARADKDVSPHHIIELNLQHYYCRLIIYECAKSPTDACHLTAEQSFWMLLCEQRIQRELLCRSEGGLWVMDRLKWQTPLSSAFKENEKQLQLWNLTQGQLDRHLWTLISRCFW